ncbi:MAG: hypothetical protein KDJ16_13415 [Hyphomicrobiales bacterium]|nr:hypothetical protein [Hyphomicrobiales bacterium]
MSATAKSGQGDASGFPEAPIAKANELFAKGSADGLTSAQVSAVVDNAENALTALRRRVAALRAATLDPALDSDAVARATSEAAAVDLEASRMEVCATRLRDRAKEIAADEADAPKWEKYNAAKAARDAAEAAILAEYPALAEKIGNLLSRAKEADRLIGMANGHLPRDVKPLPWAHFLAQPAMIGPVLLPACGKDDKDHWPLPGHNTW